METVSQVRVLSPDGGATNTQSKIKWDAEQTDNFITISSYVHLLAYKTWNVVSNTSLSRCAENATKLTFFVAHEHLFFVQCSVCLHNVLCEFCAQFRQCFALRKIHPKTEERKRESHAIMPQKCCSASKNEAFKACRGLHGGCLYLPAASLRWIENRWSAALWSTNKKWQNRLVFSFLFLLFQSATFRKNNKQTNKLCFD